MRSTDGVLWQTRLQRLAKRLIEDLPVTPIAKALGVGIQAVWAPAFPMPWRPEDLLKACPARAATCAEAASGDVLCEECVARQLDATLRAGPGGWEFTCGKGLRQLWAAIRPADFTLGVLICSWENAGHSQSQSKSTAGESAKAQRPASGDDEGQSEPGRSMVRLIVHGLEAACAEHLRAAEVERWRTLALARRMAPAMAADAPYLDPDLTAPSNPTVRSLLERLHRDFAKPITLKSLSHDLTKNESYLSAAFSASVGMTFKAYLTALRIRHGAELLVAGGQSVEEIAHACGYVDPRRFSRAFKEQTGVSPLGFRQKAPSEPLIAEPSAEPRL